MSSVKDMWKSGRTKRNHLSNGKLRYVYTVAKIKYANMSIESEKIVSVSEENAETLRKFLKESKKKGLMGIATIKTSVLTEPLTEEPKK